MSRLLGAIATITMTITGVANATPSERAQKVFDFWTAEKIAEAKPFDIVFNERGLAYLRDTDGSLSPYQHSTPNPNGALIDPGQTNSNSGGGRSWVVSLSNWPFGGTVQNVVGRILFQREEGGGYFICSGTVAKDNKSGRSTIITAAHCIYNDENKSFMKNVVFIPNQDETTGDNGTDFDCTNDPNGCWAIDFGVVDENWTTVDFPGNLEWDYGYYVVNDIGQHSGPEAEKALDETTGSLPIDFLPAYSADGDTGPDSLDYTRALGYPGDRDPNFMYCAEDAAEIEDTHFWLPSCGMTGGSSGGPWVQPMDIRTGTGPIISVNSFGFEFRTGMAGPRLSGNSARCLLDQAKAVGFESDGHIVSSSRCRTSR